MSAPVHRSRNRYFAYALVALALVALANPAVAADGSKHLKWPTGGRVTQRYGCTGFSMEPRYGSCRHFHGGIDIAGARGTPIRAAADGVITHVGWDEWGTRNWMVILKHGDGLTTWYAHMRGKHIAGLRKGVRVRQGEVIGYMDKTGMATGVHLHWAVLKNGRYVDPRDYVDGLPIRPPKKPNGTGAAGCDGASTPDPIGLSTGATAAVLEGDPGRGGSDSCAA